ncbi:MAG: GNAT family N-acetyltransferase [Bryobacteraceae bacterium]
MIRRATAADAEVIAGYNAAMASETEHLELDRERLLGGVRSILEDPSKGVYWLAEEGGEVIGQMMITYEWSDWRNGTFWWIQSVYVHKDWRCRGVFRRMYEHVVALARAEAGVCGVRLYVEGENRHAQATYERLGMKRTPYQMFEVDFVLGR